MKFRYRLLIILAIYFAVVATGFIAEKNLEKELSPAVFQNPTITVQSFLDDFITVRISCYWENKTVNMIVTDEFNNIRHNSTFDLSCKGYKLIELQGEPQDYEKDRAYRVEVHFDNQSISSGYFYLMNSTRIGLIKKEIFSFSYFMMYQSRLARGAYSDDQRLLYTDTRDPVYAENFIKAHFLGVLSTFTIFFIIDIGIWILYFIRIGLKKKAKDKKTNIPSRLS